MMKYHALTREAKLSESEFTVKRGRDVDYLMELKPENLLFSHYAEAGLNGLLNYTVTAHGGWDSLSARSDAARSATETAGHSPSRKNTSIPCGTERASGRPSMYATKT